MTSLVIAVVHYANAGEVQQFVAATRALRVPHAWTLDIIVVDNSGDAPPFEGATLVRADRNLGYLNGAALGLRARNAPPDWFVVANPDVALDVDALEVLAHETFADDVAIVAPNVLLGGVTPQNPFRVTRPSPWRMRLYTVAYRSRLLTRLMTFALDAKRFVARHAPPPPQTRAIYAPHGSVMLLRRGFFERGGTLDYRGFMFGEEIFLAEQARNLGMQVMFVPAIRAVHRGSSTTDRVPSRQRLRWHRESAEILWQDYFRRRKRRET